MVVPPKHPKMIIFSRKTLLGTTILETPMYSQANSKNVGFGGPWYCIYTASIFGGSDSSILG